MNMSRLIGLRNTIGKKFTSSGSRLSFLLDSAYVHHTSGDGFGLRFTCATADPINEVYFFVDSVVNLASITSVCYIYNAGANNARPGTTLRATSSTLTKGSGNDTWWKYEFSTPYTPAVGEIVWFVFTNTSATPASQYPQILTATNGVPEETLIGNGAAQLVGMSNTVGFSTTGSALLEAPSVIKQGSNYFGMPWTQANLGYYANNTLERGIRVTCTEDTTVVGVLFTPATNYDKFRITLSSTIPGATVGTGEVEYDLDATGEDDRGGFLYFDSPFTFLGGQAYNVTLTFDVNNQGPAVLQIEDYSTYSSMFDTLRGYDTMSVPWGIISDGGGTPAWVENKAISPCIALIIDDHPAQASGGLVRHPGMNGGLNG